MPNKTLEDRYIEELENLNDFYLELHFLQNELSKEISDKTIINNIKSLIEECKSNYNINNLYKECLMDENETRKFLNECNKIHEQIATMIFKLKKALKNIPISSKNNYGKFLESLSLEYLTFDISGEQPINPISDTLGYE